MKRTNLVKVLLSSFALLAVTSCDIGGNTPTTSVKPSTSETPSTSTSQKVTTTETTSSGQTVVVEKKLVFQDVDYSALDDNKDITWYSVEGFEVEINGVKTSVSVRVGTFGGRIAKLSFGDLNEATYDTENKDAINKYYYTLNASLSYIKEAYVGKKISDVLAAPTGKDLDKYSVAIGATESSEGIFRAIKKSLETADAAEPFKITFDSNNGNTIINGIYADAGKSISAPVNPKSKDGRAFIGWFDGDNEWDFANDTVSKDVNLVARWGYVYEEFLYTETATTVSMQKYLGKSKTVIVPNHINEKPVTTINSAFLDSKTNTVTKLILPNTLTAVPTSSFGTCQSLEYIDIDGGYCQATTATVKYVARNGCVFYTGTTTSAKSNTYPYGYSSYVPYAIPSNTKVLRLPKETVSLVASYFRYSKIEEFEIEEETDKTYKWKQRLAPGKGPVAYANSYYASYKDNLLAIAPQYTGKVTIKKGMAYKYLTGSYWYYNTNFTGFEVEAGCTNFEVINNVIWSKYSSTITVGGVKTTVLQANAVADFSKPASLDLRNIGITKFDTASKEGTSYGTYFYSYCLAKATKVTWYAPEYQASSYGSSATSYQNQNLEVLPADGYTKSDYSTLASYKYFSPFFKTRSVVFDTCINSVSANPVDAEDGDKITAPKINTDYQYEKINYVPNYKWAKVNTMGGFTASVDYFTKTGEGDTDADYTAAATYERNVQYYAKVLSDNAEYYVLTGDVKDYADNAYTKATYFKPGQDYYVRKYAQYQEAPAYQEVAVATKYVECTGLTAFESGKVYYVKVNTTYEAATGEFDATKTYYVKDFKEAGTYYTKDATGAYVVASSTYVDGGSYYIPVFADAAVHYTRKGSGTKDDPYIYTKANSYVAGETYYVQTTADRYDVYRKNFEFAGWFTSRTGSYADTYWDFDKNTVNGNQTLYARYYTTITFDANGGSFTGGATTSNVERVLTGTKLSDSTYTLPTPTKDGKTFAGWYRDAECTVEYKYETVTAGITLYAKWN